MDKTYLIESTTLEFPSFEVIGYHLNVVDGCIIITGIMGDGLFCSLSKDVIVRKVKTKSEES